MSGMYCTKCFKKTYIEPPDILRFSINIVIAICNEFLCDDCLTELEQEILNEANGTSVTLQKC